MLKNRLTLLAAGVPIVLFIAGCGGSSSPVDKVPELPSSPAGGTFEGVYRNTSGTSTTDAGTVVLTISEDIEHDTTLVMNDTTGSGTTIVFTGALGGSTSTLTAASGNTITLTFSGPYTSLGFPGTYTETNGTTGSLIVGGEVPLSVGIGSYTGTFQSSGGGRGTLSLNASSTGVVSGSATNASGQTFSLDGYIVSEDALYLAYNDGKGYQNAIGTPLLTGGKFKSKLAEQPSGTTLSFSLSPAEATPQSNAGA